jgi:hypothetical protein
MIVLEPRKKIMINAMRCINTILLYTVSFCFAFRHTYDMCVPTQAFVICSQHLSNRIRSSPIKTKDTYPNHIRQFYQFGNAGTTNPKRLIQHQKHSRCIYKTIFVNTPISQTAHKNGDPRPPNPAPHSHLPSPHRHRIHRGARARKPIPPMERHCRISTRLCAAHAPTRIRQAVRGAHLNDE